LKDALAMSGTLENRRHALLDGLRRFVVASRNIETTRLVLLQPQASDAASIFERNASDPDVTGSWAGRGMRRLPTRKPSCGSARRNGSDGQPAPT
jgi:hypothetical protein